MHFSIKFYLNRTTVRFELNKSSFLPVEVSTLRMYSHDQGHSQRKGLFPTKKMIARAPASILPDREHYLQLNHLHTTD